MKVVIRRHPSGELFVRKVNNVFDIVGEDVVGLYPDTDTILASTDVEMLQAVFRRLEKLGGKEHPMPTRYELELQPKPRKRYNHSAASKEQEYCIACGPLKDGKHRGLLCRLTGRNWGK